MERYIIINSKGYVEGLTFDGIIKTYTEEEAIKQKKYLTEKNKIKGWGLSFEIYELDLKGE